jgi:hypothetical protein
VPASRKSTKRTRAQKSAGSNAEAQRSAYDPYWTISNSVSELRDNVRSLLEGQEILAERIESMRNTIAPIIGHAERLLREKETLMKLNEANRFMATPTVNDAVSLFTNAPWDTGLQPVTPAPAVDKWWPHSAYSSYADMVAKMVPADVPDADHTLYVSPTCRFAHLHQIGVHCAICGVTP